MGKRAGITTVCLGCGRNVCQRHLDLSGSVVVCTRCKRDGVIPMQPAPLASHLVNNEIANASIYGRQ